MFYENNQYKQCSKCKIIKPLMEFTFRDKEKGTYRADCKVCVSLRSAKYYVDNREKILNRERIKRSDPIKSVKIKEVQKKYREENREEINAKQRKAKRARKALLPPKIKPTSEQKKEKRRAYMKTYNAKYEVDHKSERNAYRNERKKKKYQTDIEYKLYVTVSNSIRRLILSKNGKTIDYLPYTMKKLRKHLENLFESWMTWENWGIYNAKTW